jgi:Predicted protein-tyrosine phosphatase
MPLLYINKLIESGLDVLHLPTLDYHPVELLDLLKAVLFIEKHLENNGAVLVHCYGGVGRSGLTTSAYLVYKGLNIYEAVKHVRSIVPGALENNWQIQLLEDFQILINTLDGETTKKYAKTVGELSELDVASYKHLSKVLQFTIELYNNLEFTRNIMSRNEILRSMLHAHRLDIRDYIARSIGVEISDEKGFLEDLSHALDYTMDSRVVVLYARDIDKPELLLLCRENCDDIAREFSKKLLEFDQIISRKPIVSWDNYLDHV